MVKKDSFTPFPRTILYVFFSNKDRSPNGLLRMQSLS